MSDKDRATKALAAVIMDPDPDRKMVDLFTDIANIAADNEWGLVLVVVDAKNIVLESVSLNVVPTTTN